MKGTVQIGQRVVDMVANAASPYLFKQVFHEDFLLLCRRMGEESEQAEADVIATDTFEKMGYIMSQQAEGMAKVKLATYEDYLIWLTQFEPNDLIAAANDIASLYIGQEVQTSVPKPEGE